MTNRQHCFILNIQSYICIKLSKLYLNKMRNKLFYRKSQSVELTSDTKIIIQSPEPSKNHQSIKYNKVPLPTQPISVYFSSKKFGIGPVNTFSDQKSNQSSISSVHPLHISVLPNKISMSYKRKANRFHHRNQKQQKTKTNKDAFFDINKYYLNLNLLVHRQRGPKVIQKAQISKMNSRYSQRPKFDDNFDIFSFQKNKPTTSQRSQPCEVQKPTEQTEGSNANKIHNCTSSNMRNNNHNRPLSQPTINKPNKGTLKLPQQYNFIFGRTKKQDEDKYQKLKQLYYKDFLWKISFNRGFFYEIKNFEIYKYFVGKGNNGRLIRNTMRKRPWWIEVKDIQKAHFIWTQLKIYDIYNHQEEGTPEKLKIEYNSNHLNAEKDGRNIDDKNRYVLNDIKYGEWRQYLNKFRLQQKKPNEQMKHRRQLNILMKKKEYKINKITNHLQNSKIIGNKKALYKTITLYFSIQKEQSLESSIADPTFLPLTYHITAGLEDQEYLNFLQKYYKNKDKRNCWIVKPGQLSNRGNGIIFCSTLQQIKQQIKHRESHSNGSRKSFIIQEYIDQPLLYKKRKFDIRHYIMITSTEGSIKGYFYQEGYIRTASLKFNLNDPNPQIHLTNDAVQKYSKHYGKHQKGNKLSYEQFDQYLSEQDKSFYKDILPQIKQISKQIFQSAYYWIDPKRRCNNFQIFGIDVMVDQNFKCWLIEVNTNPCLQLSSPVLKAVIPTMIDNAFMIALDSVTYSQENELAKVNLQNALYSNKYELIFDEETDGPAIRDKFKDIKIDSSFYNDDDQNFQSCSEDDEA